jgi:hypothetical protein
VLWLVYCCPDITAAEATVIALQKNSVTLPLYKCVCTDGSFFFSALLAAFSHHFSVLLFSLFVSFFGGCQTTQRTNANEKENKLHMHAYSDASKRFFFYMCA